MRGWAALPSAGGVIRTPFWQSGQRIPWGNVIAGFVALLALLAIAMSPWIATTTFSALRHHQDTVADATANHVNQDVRDAGLDFVVHSSRCGEPRLVSDDGSTIAPAYGDFCEVDLTVHNVGTEPVALPPEVQQATGARGAVYLSDASADSMVNGGNPAIVAGQSRDAKLVYDVPPGTVLIRIDLHGSEYSRGVTVRL